MVYNNISYRGVAQVVARLTGGQEVASSSLVTPTIHKEPHGGIISREGKQMQKLVYLSNSRDYTEQGNINENKYFTNINGLLDKGWKVAHITHDVVEIDDNQNPTRKETFVAFVLLEKPEEDK